MRILPYNEYSQDWSGNTYCSLSLSSDKYDIYLAKDFLYSSRHIPLCYAIKEITGSPNHVLIAPKADGEGVSRHS